DRLAEELVRQGVPREALLLERESTRTRENAKYTAALLEPLGLRRVGLVSCDFHMARALWCFRRTGLEPEPLAVPSPKLRLSRRIWRFVREQGAWVMDRTFAGTLLLAFAIAAPVLGGCGDRAQHAGTSTSARPSASPLGSSVPTSHRLS